MKHSESIKTITEALTNMHVSYGKDKVNPFFKSKYATLGTILEAIREPLVNNGLSVTQGAKPDGNGNIIIEMLVSHISGEYIMTETFIPVKEKDPQKTGASITYGRRYALEAFFNLTADDDDGNTASQAPKQPVVRINFDSLSKTLSGFNTEKEVTEHMIKFKTNSREWTKEQIKDVNDIGMAHLERVKQLASKVKDKFEGEEV